MNNDEKKSEIGTTLMLRQNLSKIASRYPKILYF